MIFFSHFLCIHLLFDGLSRANFGNGDLGERWISTTLYDMLEMCSKKELRFRYIIKPPSLDRNLLVLIFFFFLS